jgi:hypothetical protein
MRLSRSDEKTLAKMLAREQLARICVDLRHTLQIEYNLSDTGAGDLVRDEVIDRAFALRQRRRVRTWK